MSILNKFFSDPSKKTIVEIEPGKYYHHANPTALAKKLGFFKGKNPDIIKMMGEAIILPVNSPAFSFQSQLFEPLPLFFPFSEKTFYSAGTTKRLPWIAKELKKIQQENLSSQPPLV